MAIRHVPHLSASVYTTITITTTTTTTTNNTNTNTNNHLLPTTYLLILIIILSSFHNLPLVASRFTSDLFAQPRQQQQQQIEQEQQQIEHGQAMSPADWPRFREAPSFRNGKECLFSELYSSSTATPYSAEEEEMSLCDPLSVHVAMTLDANYIRGSVAAILSIVQHSACPENVVFHFLASEFKRELGRVLRSTFPYLRFKVYDFDPGLVRDKISAAVREALEQPLNYARTYLPDILPSCVKRAIYLDSDLIVLDDIAKLWDIDLDSHPLGAPEYCHANFTAYFTDLFWMDPTLSGVFEGRSPCYFNTGVMVMDLDMWRLWGYTRAIEEWMEVQKEIRIYELGSLPPFLLVFAGDVKPMEHRWNQHGLGGDNLQGLCRTLHPGPVSLLHWSGKGKPWVRLDNGSPCSLDSLWSPYDLASASYLQS